MARNRYDMDERLEDSFDINQLKRLGHYIAPYRIKMFGIILSRYHADTDLFPADYG